MKWTPAWITVAMLWVVAMFNYLDRQVIFSLFPLLRADLQLTDTQLGLLGTAFLWVYAAFSPLAGFLGDRWGYRRVIIFSLLVWSLVTGLTAAAPGFHSLVAIRGLMGISEAFYIPSALALISAWHGPATRSRAVGIHQSGISAGIVLGGGGGAWVAEHYGWRSVFLVLAAAGLLYGLLLPLGLRQPSSTQPVARPKLVFGPALRAISNAPGFWSVLVVFTAMSIAGWLVYTWMPLFLYEQFRMSLTYAGFAATFFVQIASVTGMLAGGWIADRLSVRHPRGRIITQVAGLCLLAPFLMLAAFTQSAPVMLLALGCYGLGRGIYDCNVMPVICDVVDEAHRSTAYGMLNLAGTLAGGAAAFATGAVKSTLGIGGSLIAAGLLVLACSLLLLTIPVRRTVSSVS